MRDLGEAVVLLDQNPSLLSVPAMGNTATTICLNLKHADDLEAAGKALGLPRDRWEYLGRLPVGQGIVRVQGRHATPFLVDFPLFPTKRSLPPSQGERRPLATASVQRRAEEARRLLDEATRALREEARGKKGNDRTGSAERKLLRDVASHSFSGVTERYGRLGWSAYRGTNAKRALLKQGLLCEVRLRVPEGTVTLLELTEQGKDLLGQEGIEVGPFPKNASLEHEYWKHRVAEDYRSRGYEVEEEVHIGGGKTVDLVATKDGERIAIEIETGNSDPERNRRKCSRESFSKVLSIPTQKIVYVGASQGRHRGPGCR